MTIQELQATAKQYLQEAGGDSNRVAIKFGEFLAFAVSKYESLDGDGKAYVDQLAEGVTAAGEAIVATLPDSPTRRAMTRAIAQSRGKHFNVKGIIRGLSEPPEESALLEDAEPVFTSVLQAILDVLFDATRTSHGGAARFAVITLLYWILDELAVAYHLAKYSYSTQSFAHVRTTLELLDKVQLFHAQPKWAELWADDTPAKRREKEAELKPSSVRKKLGRPGYDPIYSFLSEVSTHGTFVGVQARTVMQRSRRSGENQKINLWIGGRDVRINFFCRLHPV